MMSKIRRAGVIALTIIATVCFAASLFWLKDVATVKAETANNSYMVMQDGASARLGGENNGLRFTTLVDKTFYDELSAATVEIGTVIIPSDLLGENLLTLETAEAKKTVLAQEKCVLKDFSETQYSYGGVLVDVKDGNLMREFTGRGYILVDEGLDTEAVYYAEQADNSRSVMYVLSAFLAAGTGEAEDVAYAEEKIAAATARGEWFNNGTKAMLFSDAFLGIYDCSVRGDGFERECFAEYEKKFALAAKNSRHFQCMYTSYEKLCKVLSVKYDLGYRTRESYQAKDFGRLRELIGDYEKCIGYFEEFLTAFRELWMSENKPHGFDVQEIRIGGTIQRLKSCCQRLKQYVDRKTDTIEELEAPLLDFDGNAVPSRRPVFCQYKQVATVNKL